MPVSTADASVPPSGDWAGDAPARVGVPDDVELPGLSDIVSSLHVVAVPLRVPFRGVRWREAALFRGPHGWAEFSPFL